ncbi:hypothetical protein ILUMI_21102 [Ignelater luminosus]|uniref:Uncharacterized protein n=1 Tax=Ignelater luminosus TaxID=2038154 RepID=A0A8K0CD52_IGNLU|nr:hypothetical protein ILUMI_21102 [Ignelater luminosus]
MIKPSSNYILITSDRRRFVVTNERCRRILLDLYLCKEQSAQVQANQEPSEIALFRSSSLSTVPQSCNLRGQVFTWTNVTANLWLIALSRTTMTEILCPSQNMVTTTIQNTVLIHLPQTC